MSKLNPRDLLKAVQCNDESAARVQLAAACRLMEHYDWSDVILNHVTARVPEQAEQFLMNPFGLMYSEVCASNLVKVDFAGQSIGEQHWPVNQAGIVLHSAIYAARPDVNSIIHTHTPAGVAVSMLECGLLCSDQMSLLFHDRVGYHDFEGIVVNEEEQQRLVKNVGKNKCLILRNHGLVALGASIAEAFWNYYYLEFACRVQLDVMATGSKLNSVAASIKTHTFAQHEYFCKEQAPTSLPDFPGNIDLMFAALLRMLDRRDDSYRN
jgi:ribulose-5-phosphate 4-epimerase/fuculose-1-phosphate aldolase